VTAQIIVGIVMTDLIRGCNLLVLLPEFECFFAAINIVPSHWNGSLLPLSIWRFQICFRNQTYSSLILRIIDRSVQQICMHNGREARFFARPAHLVVQADILVGMESQLGLHRAL
jgi:hypothetical protein